MAMTGDIDMNNITKSILQNYVIDSNEALELKLVRSSKDVEDDDASFGPDMSHQIFGDSEQIFGYAGLRIKLYYSACRLTTYLAHTYDEKVDPERFEGVQPDDVLKGIIEKLPPSFITNEADFVRSLDKDSTFKPFGELKRQFTVVSDNNSERVFEIYYHDVSPSGFASYHERIQLFLMWYIDASSFIDVDDERWRFFVLYEKYTNNGTTHYAFVGYATLYEYYAYPENIRPRISQLLILPPFQGVGLGSELLQTVYNHYIKRPEILDITVEDPSEVFTRLRDFIDVRNCSQLKSFEGHIEKLKVEMIEQAKKELGLNKKQVVRVYEILRLSRVDRHNDEEYKIYRLMVKNRLNDQFRKEDSDIKKLERVLTPEELAATMSITSKDQRIETLDKLYRSTEEQYDHVILRLQTPK